MYSANCKGMYSNLACFIRQKGEGLINQSWMAQNRAVGTYEGVRTGSHPYFGIFVNPTSIRGRGPDYAIQKTCPQQKF